MGIEHFDTIYDRLFKYGLINKATLEGYVEDAYPILKQRAANRRHTSYDKLREDLGTSKQYLGRILGTINMCEAEAGNPPLSAIVAPKTGGRTGPKSGFYIWPCVPDEFRMDPDNQRSPSNDQIQYWKDEREEVYRTWDDYQG